MKDNNDTPIKKKETSQFKPDARIRQVAKKKDLLNSTRQTNVNSRKKMENETRKVVIIGNSQLRITRHCSEITTL